MILSKKQMKEMLIRAVKLTHGKPTYSAEDIANQVLKEMEGDNGRDNSKN